MVKEYDTHACDEAERTLIYYKSMGWGIEYGFEHHIHVVFCPYCGLKLPVDEPVG